MTDAKVPQRLEDFPPDSRWIQTSRGTVIVCKDGTVYRNVNGLTVKLLDPLAGDAPREGANVDDVSELEQRGMRQRSDAWLDVCLALDVAAPGWQLQGGTGAQNAVAAIDSLAKRAALADRAPREGGDQCSSVDGSPPISTL